MSLKANITGKYPGAEYFAGGEVGWPGCCLLNTVAELAAMCGTEGYPYSIIGGEIFMEITSGQLATECDTAAPTIVSMDNAALADAEQRECGGANYGVVEGEVWVADANTWSGSGEKVQQTIDAWADAAITFTCVQGTFVGGPYTAYLYVLQPCGQPNAAGFVVTWPEP